MDVYEAVASRLAMLGYQATEQDKPAIDHLTSKCRVALLASIHHKDVPDGLIYTLVDMVAGSFLQDKLNAGELDIEGLGFSAAVKSITEGDVSTTFAGASDGVSSPEGRFLATLDSMVHPSEKILGAFRRLKW